MKKTKVLASVLALSAMFNLVATAQPNVKVYVNGMRVEEDVVMKNDRTYIPLRAVSEAMGAQVEWDDTSKSAFISFTEDDAIAQIVEDVSPSVVTIIGNYNTGGTSSSYNNPTAHGSGVIYKNNGYIVTNEHVVKDIKNLTVILNDGTAVAGKVLYSDTEADLAIVKIDKIGLKNISFAQEDSVISGKTAIAIGTPISLSMRNTVTKGIISGTDVTMSDSYYKLLQTDASINPGNSGGPLLNTKGELIGINSSKFSGVGIDNMAFAIPVDTVEYVINQFETYGYITKPQIKVELEPSWEAKIGIPTQKGLTVKTSSDDALKPGDVVVSVNGINVHSVADWNEAIKDTYISGAAVKVEITRGDAKTEVLVK